MCTAAYVSNAPPPVLKTAHSRSAGNVSALAPAPPRVGSRSAGVGDGPREPTVVAFFPGACGHVARGERAKAWASVHWQVQTHEHDVAAMYTLHRLTGV